VRSPGTVKLPQVLVNKDVMAILSQVLMGCVKLRNGLYYLFCLYWDFLIYLPLRNSERQSQ